MIAIALILVDAFWFDLIATIATFEAILVAEVLQHLETISP